MLTSKNIEKKEDPEYIVSLTTFPSRIGNVWLSIETMLRQIKKPDLIILWLYKGEFKERHTLPKNLLRLEKRGLEIRFCDDNLMPHKKYYYTMLEFPRANVITIDDDMFYPPDLLGKLISQNRKYPNAICCAITRKIEIKNGRILPYKYWKYVKANLQPSFSLLTMGGGGTLFPPNSLSTKTFDINILKEKALRADDLWIKTMSLLKYTKVTTIAGEYPYFFIPIIIKNNKRLMVENIAGGNNDSIFENLIEYYKIPLTIFEEQ